MKILIFGGSFNPPTLAHEAIISKALSLPEFDEVWVMPSTSRYDKQIPVSGDDRLKMLKLIKKHTFGNDPRLVISDYEFKLPHNSEMYKTILALEQHFPGDEFWFVFGGDSYDTIPDWPRGEWLTKNMNVIVISDTPRDTTTYSLSDELTNISSTEARRRVSANKKIDNLVSPAVKYFIQQHNLYL
jgi:nicotinate-nucleotide adenylyltransferase